MNIAKITFAVVACASISACTVKRQQGTDDYIAVASDSGQRRGGANTNNNAEDNAAIAVTPDGCQAWIIDDGVEGRASNRLDPVSGLPVCGGEPGVVYGSHQSGTSEAGDFVPRETKNVVIENVAILPTTGHAHDVN